MIKIIIKCAHGSTRLYLVFQRPHLHFSKGGPKAPLCYLTIILHNLEVKSTLEFTGK